MPDFHSGLYSFQFIFYSHSVQKPVSFPPNLYVKQRFKPSNQDRWDGATRRYGQISRNQGSGLFLCGSVFPTEDCRKMPTASCQHFKLDILRICKRFVPERVYKPIIQCKLKPTRNIQGLPGGCMWQGFCRHFLRLRVECAFQTIGKERSRIVI